MLRFAAKYCKIVFAITYFLITFPRLSYTYTQKEPRPKAKLLKILLFYERLFLILSLVILFLCRLLCVFLIIEEIFFEFIIQIVLEVL